MQITRTQQAKFPVIFRRGEKFVRIHRPGAISDLQFEVEVEVFGLEIETDGQEREISLIGEHLWRRQRPNMHVIAPECGGFGE